MGVVLYNTVSGFLHSFVSTRDPILDIFYALGSLLTSFIFLYFFFLSLIT